VPNVGPVAAAAFVVVLDDVQHFRGTHDVAAYLGLVLRELPLSRELTAILERRWQARPGWCAEP
jgi:transposase